MKKYDVFISYRRATGDMTANRLYESLRARGYRVFLDVREMGACVYDERLFEIIRGCTDYIIVLTPGTLDNRGEAENWVWREVEWAVLNKVNIIPVRSADFVFPSGLPPVVERLDRYNGPQFDAMNWDVFLNKLTSKAFMKSRRRKPWYMLPLCAVLLAAALAAAVFLFRELAPLTYAKTAARLLPAESAVSQGITYLDAGKDAYAAPYFEAALSKGSAEAGNLLGAMYYEPEGSGKDYEKALVYFEQAAQLDPDSAMCRQIGYIYDAAGSEETRSREKAKEWYEKGALLNDDECMNNLAAMYEQEENYGEAYRWYKLAAENGYNCSMKKLGDFYLFGYHVQQDYAQALDWYLQAEKAGVSDAQMYYCIGWIYRYEQSLRNAYNAEKYFEMAAELGNAGASYELGKICELRGDLWGALKHYGQAQGDADAMFRMGFIYQSGVGNDEPDYKQAKIWYEKAMEAGNGDAAGSLAYLYYFGYGVEKDTDKALELYHYGAEELGSESCMGNLGIIYEAGAITEIDMEQAIYWHKKAAELGNENSARALERLGAADE